MKRHVILALLLSCLTPLAFAGKVAVFNAQMAIMSTNAAKKADMELDQNKEYVALRAEVDSLRADLEKLKTEGETKGLTWSIEERSAHRQKMAFINEDYQLAAKKIQSARNTAMQKLVESLEPKLEAILRELMASDSIDIVLHNQAVLISKPDVDITTKVTEQLNKIK